MLKQMLAGVALSVVVVGSAMAHDGADEKVPAVVVADQQQDPSPGNVPGPPAVESPQDKVAVEYRFGATGFVRGEGSGNFNLSDNSYQPKHSEGRFLYRVK